MDSYIYDRLGRVVIAGLMASNTLAANLALWERHPIIPSPWTVVLSVVFSVASGLLAWIFLNRAPLRKGERREV